MNESPDTPPVADRLTEIRAIPAAMQREAGNKGVTEIVNFVRKADEMWAETFVRSLD